MARSPEWLRSRASGPSTVTSTFGTVVKDYAGTPAGCSRYSPPHVVSVEKDDTPAKREDVASSNLFASRRYSLAYVAASLMWCWACATLP